MGSSTSAETADDLDAAHGRLRAPFADRIDAFVEGGGDADRRAVAAGYAFQFVELLKDGVRLQLAVQLEIGEGVGCLDRFGDDLRLGLRRRTVIEKEQAAFADVAQNRLERAGTQKESGRRGSS